VAKPGEQFYTDVTGQPVHPYRLMHAHPIVSDVGSLVATALILAIALLLSTWVEQGLPLG